MAEATTLALSLVNLAEAEENARWKTQLWNIKKTIIIILIPLLLLPLPILWNTRQGRCAYVILIMIVYWMTEVVPMAVTALLPIVLFPWLGIMHSRAVCINYLKDANMLFFGGLLMAVAVEKWNLHKRVALRVLIVVGSKPKWIIFGFMLVTCFLSMWLSNTATTAMMMPISQAVLTELDNNRLRAIALVKSPTPEVVAVQKAQEVSFKKFKTALKISIPFASNIGGCGTLIGSGPNIVLKGQLEVLYTRSAVNFTSWLLIGFPIMIFDIFIAWFIILVLFIGFKKCFGFKKQEVDETATQVIKAEYVKLGKMTFAEIVVAINFLVLATLWITREPEIVPGWGGLMGHEGTKKISHKHDNGTLVVTKHFRTSYVTDASVAITICVLLFILPSQFPNYLCFRRKKNNAPPMPAPPILDWPTANRQMPWSVILLLGGGFALAEGCKVSKLSVSIGHFLISLKTLPPFVISLMMCVVTSLITQFTSNVATTTIMIPILAQVSLETCINPIYLMLPVTLCASFAFILPVGTPPNAIAFSYGDISNIDMMKCGTLMVLLTFGSSIFAMNTWGYAFLELDKWPDWAPQGTC